MKHIALLLSFALLGQGYKPSYSPTFHGHVSTPVVANVVATNASTIAATATSGAGDSQSLNLSAATGTVTVTLTGYAPGDTLVLVITQKASSPVNITWNGGSTAVKWPGGTAPTISTGASAIDVCSFVCISANTFVGSCQQNAS